LVARIPHEELDHLFKGDGWKPHFVEGDDPTVMHQQMAENPELCIQEIRSIQEDARTPGQHENARRRWPMIVLRTPKGWTGPKTVDGLKIEGSWRAHQVPILDVATN